MKLLSLRTRIKVAPPGSSENHLAAYAEHFDHPAYALDLLDNGWVSVARLDVTRLVPPDAVAWVTAFKEQPAPALAPLSKVRR